MSRSASVHSRAAVAASRARRGGRTVVVGPARPKRPPDPALASMRIDFTATVREVLEVLIAGFLARH